MTGRALVLGATLAGGALALLLWTLWSRRWRNPPERLDVDELGLALMEGCCAFVVFTTPTCRPCRAVLRVVEGAIARKPGLTEIRTVDAAEHHDIARRYEVRTVPTTFLITASGHVIERWRDVPEPAAVDAALARI